MKHFGAVRETGGEGSGNFCIVTAVVDSYNYVGDIYSNPNKSAIFTGVAIKLNDGFLASGETVPLPTKFPVVLQEWGTAGNEAYYWTINQRIGIT